MTVEVCQSRWRHEGPRGIGAVQGRGEPFPAKDRASSPTKSSQSLPACEGRLGVQAACCEPSWGFSLVSVVLASEAFLFLVAIFWGVLCVVNDAGGWPVGRGGVGRFEYLGTLRFFFCPIPTDNFSL